MSLGGSPLALLGLVLAGMASSGILPLIVCDYIISVEPAPMVTGEASSSILSRHNDIATGP